MLFPLPERREEAGERVLPHDQSGRNWSQYVWALFLARKMTFSVMLSTFYRIDMLCGLMQILALFDRGIAGLCNEHPGRHFSRGVRLLAAKEKHCTPPNVDHVKRGVSGRLGGPRGSAMQGLLLKDAILKDDLATIALLGASPRIRSSAWSVLGRGRGRLAWKQHQAAACCLALCSGAGLISTA